MSELHDPVPTREKVLVIGAGPAGLAAAAALKALEVPFDLVDRSAHVGGIWNEEREDSPTWRAMEMVSSRRFTQYEDMIQPVSFPDYLRPEQMGKYLRAYAARYDLTEHFRPGVEVRSARPFSEGVWQVEFSTGEIHIYAAVISAHGISERPHLPAWAAEVDPAIRVIHSKQWNGADGLEGRRVLVVGSGQSAADIAVDAARRALEVRWSVRTGHWIVPRHIAGMPGDVAASREPAALGKLNDAIAQTVIGRMAGDPSDVGLPKPSASVLEDAVIISDDVLDRIREGRITPIAPVTGVRADGTVVYADESDYRPDLIVLATGYETGADHLPEDVIPRTAHGELDLFLGAFPRGRDDLVVLGQNRVSGGVLPILVEQADIAAYLMKAVRDGSPALTQFHRARAGSDSAVPVTTAGKGGGLLGRITEKLGTAPVNRRAAESTPPATRNPADSSEGRVVPFVDRDRLLGRLRTVRTLFS